MPLAVERERLLDPAPARALGEPEPGEARRRGPGRFELLPGPLGRAPAQRRGPGELPLGVDALAILRGGRARLQRSDAEAPAAALRSDLEEVGPRRDRDREQLFGTGPSRLGVDLYHRFSPGVEEPQPEIRPLGFELQMQEVPSGQLEAAERRRVRRHRHLPAHGRQLGR